MSKASRGLVASADNSKVGPDYFGYYTHEIVELVSQDEDFSPFTSETPERICNGAGSFFNNGLGAGLSDFKKERLKVLLRQAVLDLTPEVDEMLDPVVAMLELRSQLRSKGTGSDGDAGQVPQKKFKMSSSSSSTSIPSHASPVNCKSSREGSESKHINSKFSDVALSEKRVSNVVRKNCAHCHTTKTPQWRIGPDGNTSLCNACGINYRKGRNVQSGSKIRADNENEEVDDDLQFLLENDSLQVEETMKKYSDELSETLGRMEQQLEELLDAVVSKCRPMTQTEKQQLRKLIQNLPPKNLDRVVQIFRRSKPVETQTLAEFFVDLEKEDNVTLWRLYYYVEAVEKARNLSL